MKNEKILPPTQTQPIEKVDIQRLKEHPFNPRKIAPVNFAKLKKSIQEFPEMLALRPILVDENNYILGGNMRYNALKELGYKEAYILKVYNLSEEQKKELIIKDNVAYGEWDWEKIAEGNWNIDDLAEWSEEFKPVETYASHREFFHLIDNKQVMIAELRLRFHKDTLEKVKAVLQQQNKKAEQVLLDALGIVDNSIQENAQKAAQKVKRQPNKTNPAQKTTE